MPPGALGRSDRATVTDEEADATVGAPDVGGGSDLGEEAACSAFGRGIEGPWACMSRRDSPEAPVPLGALCRSDRATVTDEEADGTAGATDVDGESEPAEDGEDAAGEAGGANEAAPAPGSARSGATGTRRGEGSRDATVQDTALTAPSSPVTGRAGSARGVAESRPPMAPSRTLVRADATVKEGSCHVGSRLPNAASATPASPPPTERWMGGSVGQAARADTPPPEPTARPSPEPCPSPAPGPSGRPEPRPRAPRSRSQNPIAQPSAPASATNDAIWRV
ncbi:hypothetical protein GCM10010245_59550 [Streptomyces spectabilis]|uniref:Uncharacterized protein n=1 Tax=Streptomyces spectabilis TaxID=68270 RepID=A0A7W8B1F0_STRST|nr:hypothetical protein [Streptomyces spectabilis]GGV37408.1 hypothetical protein GCM10010245_59550 [Streptomyces spectabilis]